MTPAPEKLTAEEAEHRIGELEYLLCNLSFEAWDHKIALRIEEIKEEIEEIQRNIIEE